MVSFRAVTLSCLALAPWGIDAGACKPVSSSLVLSTISTTAMSEAPPTTNISPTTTSEVSTAEATTSSTTSTAPCPTWSQITPPPADKVCGKAVSRGTSEGSPPYLSFPLSETGLTGCAKYCGDRPECVSFYAENFVPGPGAPTFKVCALFKAYEKDIPFGEGNTGEYFELGCFACIRD
ncbi:hypothetical protein ACHAPJ_011139 [Fusarium lateritium]